MTTLESAFIMNDDGIYILHNGEYRTVISQHPNYKLVIDAVEEGDFDKAFELSDMKKAVATYIEDTGLQVSEDGIVWNGEPLNGVLIDRILAHLAEGKEPEGMINFLKKLLSNPSKRVFDNLYQFLSYKGLPIDKEGYFYGYKAVTSDFKDKHTRRIDNSVGSVVKIPRVKVDDRHEVDCSHGLHVGTLEYVSSFAATGDKMVICKVNPADVVTVPNYDVTKLRCCEYVVVGEFKQRMSDTTFSPSQVENFNDPTGADDYDDEYEDEYYDDFCDDPECCCNK